MKLHEFKFLSDGSYVWNHPDPDSQITVEIYSKYTKSYIDKYNVKQEYITTIYLNAFDMSCVVDNLKTHKLQEFKVVSPPFNSLLLAVEFAKPICSKYNYYKDALTKKLKNKAVFIENGSWPYSYIDNNETEHEFDFTEKILKHLLPDQVAVFVEIGSEKLRYLIREVFAVNSKGEVINISLNDIYDKIQKEWGITPTTAEY